MTLHSTCIKLLPWTTHLKFLLIWIAQLLFMNIKWKYLSLIVPGTYVAVSSLHWSDTQRTRIYSGIPTSVYPPGLQGLQYYEFGLLQSLSRVQLFVTPWTTARRAPCPSPTPRVYSNPCPLSRWCHPTISSSVIPFCLQSFPASESFPVSQLFASGGPSFGVSASTPVLPMNTSPSNEHPGLISFRMDWLDLLAIQGTLKGLLQHHRSEVSILLSARFIVRLSNPYVTTGRTIALTRWTFVDKVMCLLFNMMSRLVITFLPRSKHLLISWLQSSSAVILEPRKIKLATVFTVSPSICHEMMGLDAMILVFWMLTFKPAFPLSSFTFIKRLFSPSSLSAIRVVSSMYLRLLIWNLRRP